MLAPHQIEPWIALDERKGDADRIGMGPAELRAPLRRERFRQYEKSIEAVDDAQKGGEPKRRAQIIRADHAADRRAKRDAGSDGCAHETEHAGAIFRRRHVDHVGVSGGLASGSGARDHAADKQPRQGRRQRHQDVIGAEPEIRGQDHRATPVAIGERALHRGGKELQQKEHCAEGAEDLSDPRGIAAAKLADELGQDGIGHAAGDAVQEERDEDEDACRFARARECHEPPPRRAVS